LNQQLRNLVREIRVHRVFPLLFFPRTIPEIFPAGSVSLMKSPACRFTTLNP